MLQVDETDAIAEKSQHIPGLDVAAAAGEPVEPGLAVSLVEHDLARRDSQIRWETAWSDSKSRYELAVRPDRRVAVVRSMEEHHVVCAIDLAEEAPQFTGMALGSGTLLSFANPGVEGIQFLVSTEDGARKVNVHQGLQSIEVAALGCF